MEAGYLYNNWITKETRKSHFIRVIFEIKSRPFYFSSGLHKLPDFGDNDDDGISLYQTISNVTITGFLSSPKDIVDYENGMNVYFILEIWKLKNSLAFNKNSSVLFPL